jgi:Na+/melibiose symporter-like transporter
VPVAAIPAGAAFAIGGSPAVVAVAAVAYAVATLAALRIPRTQVADAPATEAETSELRGVGILLAASAMGLVRGIVGFLTFFLLFDLREEPTWNLIAVLVLTGAGALFGSAVAPTLRRSLPEERMLLGILVTAVVAALMAAWVGGLPASMMLAAAVAIVATTGRLAFDSIVQRDAPDANRGRAFAAFEVRFQLAWVVGAVIPVVITIPQRVGFLVIAGVAAFALFSYLGGQRAAQRGHAEPSSDPPAAPAPDPTTVDWTSVIADPRDPPGSGPADG